MRHLYVLLGTLSALLLLGSSAHSSPPGSSPSYAVEWGIPGRQTTAGYSFSPDGALLAVGDLGCLKICRASDAMLVRTLERGPNTSLYFERVAWTADGQFIVSSAINAKDPYGGALLCVWRVEDGALQAARPTEYTSETAANTVIVRGSTLFHGRDRYSIPTLAHLGTNSNTFKGYQGVSASGEYYITAVNGVDAYSGVYRVDSDAYVASVPGWDASPVADRVIGQAAPPYFGVQQVTPGVFDLFSAALLAPLPRDLRGRGSWSPDGSLIGAHIEEGEFETLRLYDALNGGEIRRWTLGPDQTTNPDPVEFSSAGLLAVSHHGWLDLYDQTGALQHRVNLHPAAHAVSDLSLSADGVTLASASGSRVALHSAHDGAPLGTWEAPAAACALSPDAGLLAVSRYGEPITVYRTADHSPVTTLPTNGFPLRFTPDGRYLLAPGARYDTSGWSSAPLPSAGFDAVSGDSQLGLTAGGALHRISDGGLVRTFTSSQAGVYVQGALAASGGVVALSGRTDRVRPTDPVDGIVSVFNLTDGSLRFDLRFPGVRAEAAVPVALSPDGSTLVCFRYAGATPALLVYDALTGALLETLTDEVPTLDGISPVLRGLQFAPDGRSLYYLRYDGTIIKRRWPTGSAPEPPVAAADEYTSTEDETLAVAAPGLLANDTDANDDLREAVIESLPSHGALTLSPDGSFSYQPEANYHGADSFTYRAKDAAGALSEPATVSLTVTAVNDAPEAVDDSASTKQNKPVAIPVLANDADVDGDPLSVGAVGLPAHGTAKAEADGTITYSPRKGFKGTDGFDYTVRDVVGATSTARVTVTVAPPNRPPTAGPDSAATRRNTPVRIRVLANDSDPDGDPISLVSVTQGVKGRASLGGDARVRYAPARNKRGRDTFTYTISDGRGREATGRVRVTIH
jgi:VCBS repeat-containing protein